MRKASGVSHRSRVLKLELEIYRSLCLSVDTPRSLACFLLAENGEWGQLVSLKCNPADYQSAEHFELDYLVTETLKKNPRLPLQINTKEVAVQSFMDSEQVCRTTNDRFLNLGTEPCEHLATLERHRSEVSRILGPLSSYTLNRVEESMRFGPGSTTSLSGVITKGVKFSSRTLEVTPRLVAPFMLTRPVSWPITDISVVMGSKMTTVPKNAKTDRVICIEPDLNIYVQLGIGACIRERLRVNGVDLNSQVPNQELAKRAFSDELSTIDLKAASDTISYEVVKTLLPSRWFELLLLPRCDYTHYKGEKIALEKFSSMGNGYTFELESLIFYAAMLAVNNGRYDVRDFGTFGDDLVCPRVLYEELVTYLEFLGFSVNAEKSFKEGSFFESCGRDFFLGRDVRPFYLRSKHHDFWSVAYDYANSIRIYAWRLRNEASCDSRLLPPWLRCYRAVPESRRYHIPMDYGSGGFFMDRSESAGVKENLDIFGWTFKFRYIRPKRAVLSEEGCYIAALSAHGVFGAGKTSSEEAIRGRFDGATTKHGHTSVWPSLGSWS